MTALAIVAPAGGKRAKMPTEMPVPVLRALEMLRVTLARGCPPEGPYWQSPRGGKMAVEWMERSQSYRFTLDLKPPLPFPDAD